MKRAACIALALCACSLRDPRTTGPASAAGAGVPCSSSLQCGSNICFLGECRAPASNLSQVLISVEPPADAGFAQKQVRVDLRQSVVNDVTLQGAFVASGTVSQDPGDGGTPALLSGASVLFTESAPIIADQPDEVATVTDATGAFTAAIGAGSWGVLVVPPPPFPPYRTTLQTGTGSLDLHLPAPTPVSGAVQTSDGGSFAGVTVTAVDPTAGDPVSATSTADADGGYTLLLPASSALSSVRIQVGPSPATDGGTPATIPVYDPVAPDGGAIRLPFPPEATLSGVVVDFGGSPIAGAAVYARSDGSQGWSLSRSAMTAADGTFTLGVRAGIYQIEAVPSLVDAAAVSGPVSVTAPSQVTLRCPPKVRRVGSVVTADAHIGGPDFQVTASRAADRLITTRAAATTPTDTRGVFHLVADPGVYRVEIIPPASTGLPRRIVSIELPEDTSGAETPIDPILLSPPLAVVGTILGQLSPGAATTKIAGAAIAFYALDAASHSVFLGGGTSDANGQFRVVLPDVQNPGR